MLEKGMQKSWKMINKWVRMGAGIDKNPIKIRVQKNIEISSKNVTPAYPAFGPLSNPLLEENLQKNTNQQQKTARGGTSEREPAIRAQI